MNVLKFCCIAVLLLVSRVDLSAQVDCAWPEDVSCTEGWSASTMNVWLEISSAPPCSLYVKVYYKMRCLQVEVQDFNIGYLLTNPVNCATPAQINSFIYSFAFKDQLSKAVLLQAASLWVQRHSGSLPYCPGTLKILTSKWGSCMRPMIEYTFPSGSNSSVDYNPAMSWSYYENLFASTGGVPTSTILVNCDIDVCCFRSMTFCIDGNQQIQWSVGGWDTHGTCPVFGPCKYKFCEGS